MLVSFDFYPHNPIW